MSAFGGLSIVSNATTDTVTTTLSHCARFDSEQANVNLRMNKDANGSTDTGTMSIKRGGRYELSWTLTLKSGTGAVVYTIMPRRERTASNTDLSAARGEIEVTAANQEEFGAGVGIFEFERDDEIRIWWQVASGSHTSTAIEGQFNLRWLGQNT